MKQFTSYVLLQWKRTAKTALKSILVLGITALAVVLLLLGIKTVFEKEDLSLVKVGVVIPEDEAISKFAVDFISSMDSVKSICSFEYLSEDKALEKYNKGLLQAVVVLPEGFYHDVQVGLNPPAVLYFPDSPTLSDTIFKQMITSGVSFLQTAESSVYAAIDTAGEYGSKVDISDIGNEIALKYVNRIFERDKMFEPDMISPYGSMEMSTYFYLAGMLTLLMFGGLIFSFMYSSENKAVDFKLKVNGMGAVKGSVAKLIVMIPTVYLIGIILWIIGKQITEKTDVVLISRRVNYPLILLLLAVMLSVYFHIVYAISNSGKVGRFVLIIINVTGALCSGLIIPTAYLASWTQSISDFLPMKYWLMMLGGGL